MDVYLDIKHEIEDFDPVRFWLMDFRPPLGGMLSRLFPLGGFTG